MISGIIASPGITFGKAFLLKVNNIIINHKKINKYQVNIEINKFINGQKESIKQLKNIQNKKNIDNNHCTKQTIIESHILLLQDDEMIKDVIILIKKYLLSAAAAVEKIINKQIKLLEKLNDQYLKERIIDIKDIGSRLIKNILNININDFNDINKQVILIAKDLTPSETAQLNLKNILGFITDLGSRTSHTAIMARSLEIPAIVGTGNITKQVQNDDFIVLDSISNKIYINPDNNIIKNIKLKHNKYIQEKEKLVNLSFLPSYTKDHYKITVGANIGSIQDLNNAKKNGAECIGLYRTEFLFMNRISLPTEEEQFNAYKNVAEKMNNQSVIIRTLDIGGDKNIPYMNLPKEDNPFLGWRAIRITMDRKDILHTQLRAILRASIFGKLSIMFPMIISLEEVLLLKSELNFLKKQLYKEKKDFNSKILIGIMIETPASAIISESLAKEIDFFSIGTNDLTQYTLAVDRGNDLISHLYNPMHPAIFYLIKKVIDASHAEGKWTGMCGELASDEKLIPVLLGMGLNELSMSAISIPKVKNIIRNINMSQAKELANKILSESTAKKINQLLNNN
ncbi:phosphoenolpyruvate-protein phosphotransferase PtsI [Enterobacteriaceae endosymbiont of Neohaemonia nigricornis]|uniref:phosphoenolpyruvate-protein phosphotransferase PtsI n=1 Tax=Enterobacteriaceae endosymbiont of Neohaemonia nigricornis TaxID=2675792 RepID=UPI0014494805|nr:phosphoenolpyruvate-protein phosphotransferase PtsI [Enterobacteriaceae endosymbiont of Neohaemonia nigricornis]QJC30586.1 phosphoenolpyruvate-protein phosphotransferase PtsI [Enterobacteriaceae endosymbiont of Neohaemonia nigricornis]